MQILKYLPWHCHGFDVISKVFKSKLLLDGEVDLKTLVQRRRQHGRVWRQLRRVGGGQVVSVGRLLQLVEPALPLLLAQHPGDLHLCVKTFLESAILAALSGAGTVTAVSKIANLLRI